MKPLLVSSGEPAGIGPDLCLALAHHELPIVILGDKQVLSARARELNLSIKLVDYQPDQVVSTPGYLSVLSVPCPNPVQAGQLAKENASYVVELLNLSAQACGQNEFSALVTAPVHKAIINSAGISFTGHTEFFANYYGVDQVVMMLACEQMKVALVTTHLPLSEVAHALSFSLIVDVIRVLNQSLIRDFALKTPKIKVAGLNPHAGESGYLGREELDIIIPALDCLRKENINLEGPLPADTLFTQKNCDAYLAMYHDQGLPVLKYAGFNQAVNVTLGLPIVRTSVDHGTALELAGTGLADPGSLLAAVNMAITISQNRAQSA